MPILATADQRQVPHARQAARRELVRSVEEGMTVREAQRRCPVRMYRSTVYRLLKRVEREGEDALVERRHGHPSILRGEVLTFLLDYCQSHASATSHEVQCLVAERFDLWVSVSQLNRVRAAHGLSRKDSPREKKHKTGVTITSGSHEQAGGLLLLAPAIETGLLTQLEQALPPPPVPPEPLCLPLAGGLAAIPFNKGERGVPWRELRGGSAASST